MSRLRQAHCCALGHHVKESVCLWLHQGSLCPALELECKQLLLKLLVLSTCKSLGLYLLCRVLIWEHDHPTRVRYLGRWLNGLTSKPASKDVVLRLCKQVAKVLLVAERAEGEVQVLGLF